LYGKIRESYYKGEKNMDIVFILLFMLSFLVVIPVLLIILLIFFLLKKPLKSIIWVLIIDLCFAIVCFVGCLIASPGTEEENKIEEREEEELLEREETENEESQNETEDGIERISSGEYLFITNEDLDKYGTNLEGVKIYVVVEIDDIKEGSIQSTLSDDYMMSNFFVGENYEIYASILSRKDIVGIYGTVAGSDSYGFMGKSVNVEDCFVFAVGENAEKYKKDSSDEGLSEYFVVTEDVADSGEDISEKEYKALCKKLDYEDILRNPDNNKEKYCIVEGTVEQIIEDWFDSYTIYVTDNDGNRWECVYSYKEGEPRLLEGDSVIVYGKCKGTENVETIMGKQITLPRIDAEYINVIVQSVCKAEKMI